jgi:hypothetical protein
MYCVVAIRKFRPVDKRRFRMALFDILVNTDPVFLVHVFKLYNDQAQRHVAD